MGEQTGDVADTIGAVACLASSRAYARGVTSTAGKGGAGETTLARLGDGVLGLLCDVGVDTLAWIFSDTSGRKTGGAGVENCAGSSTSEGGLGVANDACLRLALFAIAEPPARITESRFRGPPWVPTLPALGTTIFFAGESTTFSPSSTENGHFRFVRPEELGVEGVAKVNPEGLGLTVLPEGRAGDLAPEWAGAILKIGSSDCALMADTGPGVTMTEAIAVVLGLRGVWKADVAA